MKLLSPGASPFVAKVAMVAKHCGVEVEMVAVDVKNGDSALDDVHPLSRIPCLVLDDGLAIYDSRTITRYLNRSSGGSLFPKTDPDLVLAERMEALCDGINDSAVGYHYEGVMRPQELVHKPWQDRLWGKVERGLDALAGDLPPSEGDIHIGSIALFATLGYLELRFAGKWENGRDKLVSWGKAFESAHRDLSDLKPSA